ncbi:YeiH family protein [Pararhodobacter sp. CCB-MM2]|uniref:YeiH family protein n=1 Tax=Pararhodobacter sp. CCB-MM2 TaxID=1786003 RepID=UPI000833ABC6|nr:putative sulfate exporter family transporter [Pararhodobacter sp. CCB-MM2]
MTAGGLVGSLRGLIATQGRGLMVVALVALAAKFLSLTYGAPAMLMALLLGIAVNFLSEDPRCAPGIQVGARAILRIGVALLGVRISVDMLRDLGAGVIGLVIAGVLATIAFGVLLGWIFRRDTQFGLLSGGSVAICGASAAMALSAILPDRDKAERDLGVTILGVTIMSTLAMVLYPVLARHLSLDDMTSGIFLGASIHDVAQVVGAGFSLSEPAGEVAVLVKLIRVAMLAPVVVILSLWFRRRRTTSAGEHPPAVPGFLLAFAVLAIINSFGLIPELLRSFLVQLSGWALLLSMASVGIRTAPGAMIRIGGWPLLMILAQTLFLLLFVLGGLHFVTA